MNPARDKNEGQVPGGEKGRRRLRPLLVRQNVVEGETQNELSWRVKVIVKRKKKWCVVNKHTQADIYRNLRSPGAVVLRVVQNTPCPK